MFIVRVLEAAELKKAIDEVDKGIAKQVENAKWAGKKEDTLNGMGALKMLGSGTVKGKPVDLGLVLIETPSKKVLMVLLLLDHANAAAHKAEIDAFLTSIKPAP